MSKAKWMFWAARPFAIPWVFVNTLLGATLAGIDWLKWLVAFVMVGMVLVASHYINSWRDFIRGFDKLEEGSTAKPYTSASQILPRGLLDTSDVTRGALVLLALATALMVVYAPRRLDVWLLYALGLFCAVTYTDFFKVHAIGEIPLFLGHGFGASTFAYSLIKPIDSTAIAVGILLGLWSAMAYTLDQYKDVETDFAKRAKDLAYLMFKAQIKPSAYVWFVGSATTTLAVAFVIVGILPTEFLSSLSILPLVHITGIVIDYDFDKGVLLALLAMWLYALVPTIVLLA